MILNWPCQLNSPKITKKDHMKIKIQLFSSLLRGLQMFTRALQSDEQKVLSNQPQNIQRSSVLFNAVCSTSKWA